MTGEDLSLRLADGRRIGYAEYGAPSGCPIFLFHGVPSSRLMFRVVDDAGRRLGARLIAPDRPGIGRSDPQPARRIVDWPSDAAELADRLGIERFDVVGVSGGGPYALACALNIPNRLGTVGVVSGAGPVADESELGRSMAAHLRMPFALARRGGIAYTLLCVLVGAAARCWPVACLRLLTLHEPPDERSHFMNDAVHRALEAGLVEAFAQGYRGPADDFRLIACPWGFDPGAIRRPVLFWHGEADTIVPPQMARHLAGQISQHSAHWISGAGHLFGLSHADIIIGALAAQN